MKKLTVWYFKDGDFYTVGKDKRDFQEMVRRKGQPVEGYRMIFKKDVVEIDPIGKAK